VIDPQPYSHDDFTQNPGKYVLFRTARIAETVSSTPSLTAGTLVSIQYYATQRNKVRGDVDMPVYLTWTDDADLKANPSMLYACALKGFCL
jgi:hypothetical protein